MADASMYILNPVFQTRSFDDMVKPLTMYVLAYKEQEAKIEDMTDKAAALEWIANQNPDSQTAALYKDMSAKIQGLRDDIMMNGLTGGLRSRILGARRMYSANSAEITRRYEDMKKYQDKMDELSAKDNSMVFSTDTLNVSLDDFAGGKRPQIKAISGNEIMARGAAVGKRLTSQIFGDGVEGLTMGSQFWKIYQQQGMDDAALYNALHEVGQSDKFKMAKEVIDGVYNSFGDFNPVDQQILKNRFIEGVYAGSVYNRQVDYKSNEDHLNPLQQVQRQNMINEDARAAQEWNYKLKQYAIASGEPFTAPDGKTYQYNPVNDTFVETATKKATPAKTTVATNGKAGGKSTGKGKANTPKVVGVDSKGQKIDVTNNTAKGIVLQTGTPELRKEWNDAWNMIKRVHKNEMVPGVQYRVYKYVEESSSDGEGGKTQKVRYYAEPVIDNNSSITTAPAAPSSPTTTEPII